jgi:type IV pilus assembly protein PilA
MLRWLRPVSRRGFTLVELMAVVAIVGVLAAVGIVAFSRRVHSAKSTEAMGMVQSIRAAEERARAETNAYLDVSTNLQEYYPDGNPGTEKRVFDNPSRNDALSQRWRLLNPTNPGMVQFSYAVKAGPPGTRPPQPDTSQKPDWTKAPAEQSWYLIQAMGDTNGDKVYSYFLASSLTGDVYWENEGE